MRGPARCLKTGPAEVYHDPKVSQLLGISRPGLQHAAAHGLSPHDKAPEGRDEFADFVRNLQEKIPDIQEVQHKTKATSSAITLLSPSPCMNSLQWQLSNFRELETAQ